MNKENHANTHIKHLVAAKQKFYFFKADFSLELESILFVEKAVWLAGPVLGSDLYLYQSFFGVMNVAIHVSQS